MIVEDDSLLGALLAQAVRLLMGGRAVWVRTAREALGRVALEGPDIAVIDAGLPDADGWALVERLRTDRDLHWLPVVGISGIGPIGAQSARCAGCDAYLSKPFDLDDLLAAIDQAIAARERHAPMADTAR